MSLSKSFKVHVTFGDSKRVLTLNKGEGVAELRYNFLRCFSDELSDDVPPGNIKFQRYVDKFDDYEDVTSDAKLTENMKLLALSTKAKSQESTEVTFFPRKHHGERHPWERLCGDGIKVMLIKWKIVSLFSFSSPEPFVSFGHVTKRCGKLCG